MFVTRAFSGLTRLAVLASRVVCLIVIAWFVVFAVDRTGVAATHQVNELYSGAPQRPAAQVARESEARARAQREGTAKRTLDQAAEAITSPFSALTSSTSSAWLAHGMDTLLALLVYGLGVSFVARLARLRI